jgi:hypothetical protein
MFKYVCAFLLLVSGLFGSRGKFFVGGFDSAVLPSDVYRPGKPLMWDAKLKVDRAIMLSYERDLYHFGRYLELYSGISGGFLESFGEKEDSIQTFGGYLMARLYFVKVRNFQMFFMWSPAGPSFLTKREFATTEFSNLFVFQDQFGIGIRVKGKREYDFFVKLYHFSNGDIFPINGGIDIPLLIGFGVSL